VVFDFRDSGKGNFYDCAVSTKHFDARGRQRLRAFHTTNCTPDSPPISGDDLYVVLAVKGLECGERFGYFHV